MSSKSFILDHYTTFDFHSKSISLEHDDGAEYLSIDLNKQEIINLIEWLQDKVERMEGQTP